jgi:hypothetical protein
MWQGGLRDKSGQVHVGDRLRALVVCISLDSASDAETYAVYVHPEQWEPAVLGITCGYERLMLWVATRDDQARALYPRGGMAAGGHQERIHWRRSHRREAL